jgi:hypothetical protein
VALVGFAVLLYAVPLVARGRKHSGAALVEASTGE